MSLPIQMVAYYVQENPDGVTEQDIEAINDVVSYEVLKEKFDPHISDPIKDVSSFTRRTQYKFLKIWIKMIVLDPKTMARGFYLCTSGYYNPNVMPEALYIRWGMDIGRERRMQLGLEADQINVEMAQRRVSSVFQTPIVHLFAKIGLYSWVVLLMSFVLLFIPPTRRYLLCMMPLIMILVGCIFSPVNGLYRYAYPMILSVPVVFPFVADRTISCIEKIRNSSNKPSDGLN